MLAIKFNEAPQIVLIPTQCYKTVCFTKRLTANKKVVNKKSMKGNLPFYCEESHQHSHLLEEKSGERGCRILKIRCAKVFRYFEVGLWKGYEHFLDLSFVYGYFSTLL